VADPARVARGISKKIRNFQKGESQSGICVHNARVIDLKHKRVVIFIWCLSLIATWTAATAATGRRATIISPKPDDLVILNGCVVSACNYLASIRARHSLAQHFWSRILLVRYKSHPSGHAYCVWETDGQIFGYDRSGGSFPIPTRERDATPIATSLATELERFLGRPMIVQSAEFIEPDSAKVYTF
jgi:hypothetical protein